MRCVAWLRAIRERERLADDDEPLKFVESEPTFQLPREGPEQHFAGSAGFVRARR
jgi:hypothetical protein